MSMPAFFSCHSCWWLVISPKLSHLRTLDYQSSGVSWFSVVSSASPLATWPASRFRSPPPWRTTSPEQPKLVHRLSLPPHTTPRSSLSCGGWAMLWCYWALVHTHTWNARRWRRLMRQRNRGGRSWSRLRMETCKQPRHEVGSSIRPCRDNSCSLSKLSLWHFCCAMVTVYCGFLWLFVILDRAV